MKRVLLHSCCGICAIYSIERLKAEGFYVEVFFYNSNISPQQEYEKRKEVLKNVASIASIKIVEDNYEHNRWRDLCGKYKDNKEGGHRCLLCYRLRLKEVLRKCEEKQFDYFATTLTISPHKNSQVINEIGRQLCETKFLAIDFKKDGGFKKTMDSAKKYNLYRQNYCGCVYSQKNMEG